MAWRRYVLTLTAAVLAALVVRHTLVTAYRVPTGSMQPALKPGDFIFSSRVSYGLQIPGSSEVLFRSVPERGDLVVFTYPNQPGVNSVKRVVALPGDRVQLKANRLILNGRPADYQPRNDLADNPNPAMFEMFQESDGESSRSVIFEKEGASKDFGPIVVPVGEVFLLGDNRDTSDDSRYWGTVPLSQISGQAFLIWLSLDWQNRWGDGRFPAVRWNRVLSQVH